MPAASARLRFEPVTARGYCVHVYLDDYYVARISLHGAHCNVDSAVRNVPDAE